MLKWMALSAIGTAQCCAVLNELAPGRRLDATAAWVYTKHAGDASDAAAQKATWGAASPTCVDGLKQSPIDIVTGDVAHAPVLKNSISLPSLSGHFVPKHSGHAFQLDADLTEKKKPNKIGPTDYQFVQVHWHTPAENTIDGERAAMEGHFVHSSTSGSATYLAVVAVLYDLSPTCNEVLDDFWDQFPTDAARMAPPTGYVPLGDMVVPLLHGGFWQWTGSLTTPPCTEGVEWVMLKKRLSVCQRQVDRLKLGLGNVQAGVDVNNRATNPLNHRVVADDSDGSITTSFVASMPVGGASKSPSTATWLTGGALILVAAGLSAWKWMVLTKQQSLQPVEFEDEGARYSSI